MSDQGHNRRPSSHGPPISQPHQYIDSSEGHKFTPYYKTPAEAAKSPGDYTEHLHNGLKHPPEEFPQARSQYPKSDPIMDARREGGSKPGELSYEEVVSLKDIKDLTLKERHARDKKEFSVSPPSNLPKEKKQIWVEQYAKLFHEGDSEADMDPHKHHPRRELRRLTNLAEMMAGGTNA